MIRNTIFALLILCPAVALADLSCPLTSLDSRALVENIDYACTQGHRVKIFAEDLKLCDAQLIEQALEPKCLESLLFACEDYSSELEAREFELNEVIDQLKSDADNSYYYQEENRKLRRKLRQLKAKLGSK